jgi:hypothetical protein
MVATTKDEMIKEFAETYAPRSDKFREWFHKDLKILLECVQLDKTDYSEKLDGQLAYYKEVAESCIGLLSKQYDDEETGNEFKIRMKKLVKKYLK